MPRKPKAPYGYKADGTPYLRKPQARWAAKSIPMTVAQLEQMVSDAEREAARADTGVTGFNYGGTAALDKLAQGSQEMSLYEGITGAKYEPTVLNPIPAPSALAVQVGGGHYKDMPIQPVEFIYKNKLDFLQGCIVKRICRFRTKNGLEDLEKIKHEVDLLIQLEYGK